MNMKIFIFAAAILLLISSSYASVSMDVLGVRVTDAGTLQGVLAELNVEVMPGTGRVFVETRPLTEIDTQASARLARDVACQTLEMDCSGYDFFYSIYGGHHMIGGPSAGAAMTVSTMAALQGTNLRDKIFLTGTISPSGRVGSVGAMFEKSEVAYKNGAYLVLIPYGEATIEIDGSQVDLPTLAKNRWGLNIVEVRDITEAYTYLTGFRLVRDEVTSIASAEKRHAEVMEYLCDNLMASSERTYQKAENALRVSALTDSSIISHLDAYLNSAKNEIENARRSFERNEFYSASSFSVRAMINSQYVLYVLRYEQSQDRDAELEKILGEVTFRISSFENSFLQNRKIDSYDDIEAYAVVIDRLREAEEILQECYDARDEGDDYRVLYLASFAEVRKDTAYSWLTLVNLFEGELDFVFNPDSVSYVAQERIEHARTSIVYARTMGAMTFISRAQEHLDKAIRAYGNENYVFALFEASKSTAISNLALETRVLTEDNLDTKLEELEEDAVIFISKAQEKGLLPILALSYLEFGRTLKEDDPLQAMIFFSYSKEMSIISEELFEAALGRPPLRTGVHSQEFFMRPIDNVQVLVDILLFITGILAGSLLAINFLESKKK